MGIVMRRPRIWAGAPRCRNEVTPILASAKVLAFEESPPIEYRIGILKPRERSGAICEERKDRVDFGEEVAAQTSLPTFVPENRFCQFVRDFWREPDWNHSRVR
jgi:hypothetical protein